MWMGLTVNQNQSPALQWTWTIVIISPLINHQSPSLHRITERNLSSPHYKEECALCYLLICVGSRVCIGKADVVQHDATMQNNLCSWQKILNLNLDLVTFCNISGMILLTHWGYSNVKTGVSSSRSEHLWFGMQYTSSDKNHTLAVHWVGRTHAHSIKQVSCSQRRKLIVLLKQRPSSI